MSTSAGPEPPKPGNARGHFACDCPPPVAVMKLGQRSVQPAQCRAFATHSQRGGAAV